MDPTTRDFDPAELVKALSSAERELLLILTMSPEPTGELEDELVDEDERELISWGGTLRNGLILALQKLENLRLVSHNLDDKDFAPPESVWRLTERGRCVAKFLLRLSEPGA